MRFCLLLLIFLTLPRFAIAQSEVSGALAGVVFEDTDGDGRRGPGEPGLAGVVVCSRSNCTRTDDGGIYEVAVEPGYRVVYVSQPDGYRAVRAHWRRVPADPFEWLVSFPLRKTPSSRTFSFIHASDTHLDEESLPRMRLLRELTEARGVDFIIITSDLVRDALRVPAETALERYELFRKEKDAFPVPVWVVPGNHENFGIERHLSGVSEEHPLYGKAMYRRFLGPNYYSFNYGGVHFVALDTVDIADKWYYAHVDATQMSWLDEDLSMVPPETPIITFNHIPLFSAVLHGWGYYPEGGSLIEIDGREQYRHMVSNYAEVLERFVDRNYPLAIGGHGHAREGILLGDRRFETRFHQTAAVVGDIGKREGMQYASGVTLYRMRDGKIEGWEFILLDEPSSPSGTVDSQS